MFCVLRIAWYRGNTPEWLERYYILVLFGRAPYWHAVAAVVAVGTSFQTNARTPFTNLNWLGPCTTFAAAVRAPMASPPPIVAAARQFTKARSCWMTRNPPALQSKSPAVRALSQALPQSRIGL